MKRTFSEIAEEALTLPQNEQLRLAGTLLENTESSGDLGADAAWEEQIERRIQIIDAELAKGRPFSEVLKDVDRRLGSREPGLGSRFRDEVVAILKCRDLGHEGIVASTSAHYPHYVVRSNAIWIVAIAHGHRRPEFWIDRI